MNGDLGLYKNLLDDIKNRIRQGQLRVNLKANAELLSVYWDIGHMIYQRKQDEGWGKRVIHRLAKDLKNELVEIKGFSERNLKFMVQFYQEYKLNFLITKPPVSLLENPSKDSIGKLSVSQLQNSENQYFMIMHICWAHHIILIQRVKELSTRYWYMQQTISNSWSRDILVDMVKSNLHLRQGNTVNNFEKTLPAPQSKLVKQMIKDPYIFDFMTLSTPFTERELELELVKNVQQFLLELGAGFAFVGRQFKLDIGNKEFYLDLLFYHLKMRCFVVIDLKKGDFLPEYAGKMNFYCSAVDDMLKQPSDQSTIGLILCQGKDKLFVEYALKDINKPIGISEYELTRNLPEDFKSSLPSIEDIENEFSHYQ